MSNFVTGSPAAWEWLDGLSLAANSASWQRLLRKDTDAQHHFVTMGWHRFSSESSPQTEVAWDLFFLFWKCERVAKVFTITKNPCSVLDSRNPVFYCVFGSPNSDQSPAAEA